MIFEFPNVTVLKMSEGVSKAGNAYGIFKFLSSDYQVFEMFASGESLDIARTLNAGSCYTLVFEMAPRRGAAGIDFVLKGVK